MVPQECERVGVMGWGKGVVLLLVLALFRGMWALPLCPHCCVLVWQSVLHQREWEGEFEGGCGVEGEFEGDCGVEGEKVFVVQRTNRPRLGRVKRWA